MEKEILESIQEEKGKLENLQSVDKVNVNGIVDNIEKEVNNLRNISFDGRPGEREEYFGALIGLQIAVEELLFAGGYNDLSSRAGDLAEAFGRLRDQVQV